MHLNHLKPSLLRSKEKIKPLKQKTKDLLTIIGILALEALFIFGLISNFYRYMFLKVYLDIYLAIFSTIGAAVILVFIIAIFMSYLEKRKVIKSFQKPVGKT